MADAPDSMVVGDAVKVFFYVAGGMGGVMLAVAQGISLFRKPQSVPGTENVTWAELTTETTRLETELRTDITRLEADVKELRQYTRERIHDLGNRLHSINLRLVYMTHVLTQLCDKQGITVPPPPVIDTKDDA